MRKRKLWWLVGGLVLVVLAVVGFVAWRQPLPVTADSCAQVRQGMSRAEVESLLGPPGDYTTGPVLSIPLDWQIWGVKSDGGLGRLPTLQWHGDAGTIFIAFGSNKVVNKHFEPAQLQHQSLLENLLWRAERQWRRWFSEKQ
jgi:hypothetical protein